MVCSHKHKVNEARKRSLLKTLTARVIEIAIDTLLIGSIYSALGAPHAYELALGAAILVEFFCAVTYYINERLWNKVNWGREVEDIE